jgi:copper chaperone CopZ
VRRWRARLRRLASSRACASERAACYGQGVKTELQITGMTCQRCQRHVEAALRQQPGVTQAAVVLAPGSAVVEHDDQVSIDALCAAVVDAGYECKPAGGGS